jgi:hypothetical protein
MAMRRLKQIIAAAVLSLSAVAATVGACYGQPLRVDTVLVIQHPDTDS